MVFRRNEEEAASFSYLTHHTSWVLATIPAALSKGKA